MNTTFAIGDRIYKKKYMGNALRADKNNLYTIICIFNVRNITIALLDNGTSFDIVDNGIEYAEKEKEWSSWLCCM
jgi:hypothetical protein